MILEFSAVRVSTWSACACDFFKDAWKGVSICTQASNTLFSGLNFGYRAQGDKYMDMFSPVFSANHFLLCPCPSSTVDFQVTMFPLTLKSTIENKTIRDAPHEINIASMTKCISLICKIPLVSFSWS